MKSFTEFTWQLNHCLCSTSIYFYYTVHALWSQFSMFILKGSNLIILFYIYGTFSGSPIFQILWHLQYYAWLCQEWIRGRVKTCYVSLKIHVIHYLNTHSRKVSGQFFFNSVQFWWFLNRREKVSRQWNRTRLIKANQSLFWIFNKVIPQFLPKFLQKTWHFKIKVTWPNLSLL